MDEKTKSLFPETEWLKQKVIAEREQREKEDRSREKRKVQFSEEERTEIYKDDTFYTDIKDGKQYQKNKVTSETKDITEWNTDDILSNAIRIPNKEKEEIEIIRGQVNYLIYKKELKQMRGMIVKHILKTEHILTTRDDKGTEMWIYKDGIYIPNGKTFIQEKCFEICGDELTVNTAREIIHKIELKTYMESSELYKEVEARYIPLQNGIYDLETNQLIDFDPELRFFTKLNITYDAKAECKEFNQFLNEVLPNKDDHERMQELFGLIIYRKSIIHKAAMFTGGGRNGKGRLTQIIRNWIGIENASSKSLASLDPEEDKFAVADLHKMYVNISEDESGKTIQDASVFKQVTSGDRMQAQRKFGQPFKFEPYATLIMCCNEVPNTREDTDAFFARWEIFDFPIQFLTQADMDERVGNGTIPQNIRLQAPERIKAIMTPSEFSGIFNWAVIGLKRILAHGSFSHSGTINQVRALYKSKAEPFTIFINTFIEEGYVDGSHGIRPQEITAQFNVWKKENNIHKVVSDRTIKKRLEETFEFEVTKQRMEGTITRFYYGIRWKEKIADDTMLPTSKNNVSGLSGHSFLAFFGVF